MNPASRVKPEKSEIKNAFDISVLSDGRIEGVLFDIEDALVDLRTAAIEAFIALSAEKLKDVTPAVLCSLSGGLCR
ncbi:hypothetical protein [Arthrobacter sp. MYb224]|uniref:hypothetical protein n=1 Tax=Arthrobacter sp. MYb224 TaxID=1848600 RepID=UPI0011B00F65|nr:hypothetical protein [Arthrobacter sp. MYb224]